ncbi:MAG TPA: hypothetical protein PKA58_10920 [Polyangium sp.]|nr:hypothetical protein [Polyangium sp.]
MNERSGIWFVYRSHYEGPLSRRIRRLEDPSILAWFTRMMNAARTAENPDEIYEKELGGSVYGLGSLFEATKEENLRSPKDIEHLQKLLKRHLYVEGEFRLDEHSLRVLTDDDEVQLAYFFLDDEAVKANPERLAWLFHDEPRLPDGESEEAFAPPFKFEEILPKGEGEGTTYCCFYTFYDSESLPGNVVTIPGVRLPDLASHLRNVLPTKKTAQWSKEWLETWPIELRLLRAMIEPGQISIAPALSRCASYPLRGVASGTNHSHLGVGPHANAHKEFDKVSGAFKLDGDPTKSVIQVGRHAALFCPHTSKFFGHEQWVLFDDQWAAANPQLAMSLLRYGGHWDPLREPKKARKELSEAEIAEQAWKKELAPFEGKPATAYRATERFVANQVLDHSKFGRGIVKRVDGGKVEVLFQSGTKLLAHDLKT